MTRGRVSDLPLEVLDSLENTAVELATLAGAEITLGVGRELDVRYKRESAAGGPRDPVSEVDHRIERLVRERLAAQPDRSIREATRALNLREFYERVRERLNQGGVVGQFVPLPFLTPKENPRLRTIERVTGSRITEAVLPTRLDVVAHRLGSALANAEQRMSIGMLSVHRDRLAEHAAATGTVTAIRRR